MKSLKSRRTLGWVAATLAAAMILAACSSKPSKPEPAALQAVSGVVRATQAWSAQLGPVSVLVRPAVTESQVVVATSAGQVLALDSQSGRELWRVDVGAPVEVGVGYDGETAAVVTTQNELVVLAQGRVQWRTRLGYRVFTLPLVAGQRVFVLGGDRAVNAFDGKSGTKLWSQAARATDPLILQQGGVLVAVGDTLVAGIAGRLTGLNPSSGSVRWEAPIATPRGVNEIERLVDLVGRVGRVDNQICVRAFQAAVGCVDAVRGSVTWTKPANGATGVHADADRLYGVESNGRVQSWKRADGEALWRTDALLHRGLTDPLAAGRSIVVGDASGFVHLLSREDGSLLNRLTTDGSAIVAAPVLSGQTLIALTRNGGLYGWRPE